MGTEVCPGGVLWVEWEGEDVGEQLFVASLLVELMGLWMCAVSGWCPSLSAATLGEEFLGNLIVFYF